mmetsp:Transcript_64342/g.153455  ORF Transcript_64342/g.153455 Transcript_64342/m.153455 type:complete len:1576 (-) Transcript_64342:136-4863(-)
MHHSRPCRCILSLCLWASCWATIQSTAGIERAGSSTPLPTFGEDRIFNGSDARYLVSVEAAGARCAIAADFDDDGRMDLVVASSSDNSVAWYRRLEDGSYSTKQMISRASNGARIVAVGDIDQDNLTDVISASYYDHTVRWFRNLGGSFGPAQVITTSAIGAQGVSLVDIDNDGDLDVLSASSGDNTIAWYENLGEDGKFCEVRKLIDDASIGVRTVISADLDQDGLPDLAAASKDDNTIAWYKNLGGGSFQKIVIDSTATGAYSLVATDVDRDGVVDLVTAANMEGVTEESGEGGKVSFYKNVLANGTATFAKVAVTAEDDFDYFVLSVWAGDLDGDGDVDIASASFGLVHSGSISWYENVDGTGLQWERHRIYQPSVFHAGHYIFGADMDADGDTDLVAVTHADNKVQILYASTPCDSSNDAPSAQCCPAEHVWNGTHCSKCPVGTFAEANTCVPCATGCPRAGLTYLPKACHSLPACGDVEQAYRSCDCDASSHLDRKTSYCTPCPAGFLFPRTRNRTASDYNLETVTAPDGSTSIQSDLNWEAFNATQDCLAPDCEAGTYFSAQMGQCSECLAGSFSTGGAVTECTVCPGGHSCSASSSSPTPCLPGYFAAAGAEVCSSSPAGSVVPASRMTAPVACQPGYFSVEEAASECLPCAVATFSSQEGQTACEFCGEGKSSPELWTTMRQLRNGDNLQWVLAEASQSNASCGCEPGSRSQVTGGVEQCVRCTEGMLCLGLGDVSIEEGYYALQDLSIYKCHGKSERCAGGLPGEVCAPGRTGLTCAECMDGMTPGDNGTCKECGGSDRGIFLAILAAFIVVMTAGYHLVDTQNRATQSHAVLLAAFAMSQLVTVTQQLGVVGRLTLDWKEPLISFFRLFSLVAFNIEVLRLRCVSALEPVAQYTIKVCMIVACIALITIIHGGYVVCRHHRKFAARAPILFSAIGTLFMVFYISVTSSVLEPLQCQQHPNGKWTVSGYQSILCWDSGDHTAMLVVSCIALLAVPVAFLASAVHVVQEYPRRMKMGDDKFLRAFAFFFFRFRAQRYFYVLVHLTRSFLLSLVLVIPDVVLQITVLSVILIAGCAATSYWMPWRVKSANAMDCLFGAVTLLLVNMAALYVPEDQKNLEGVALMAVVGFMAALLLVPAAVAFGLYQKYFRKTKPFDFFLCHHKAASGAWTRLLKTQLLETGKIRRDVFIDSDNLDNLDFLFDYVGNDTQTFTVIATRDICSRAWCMGEICTAQLKHVDTVVIALPSWTKIGERQIEEIEGTLTNLEVLIENGMSIEMLQTSLRWLSTVPSILTPTKVNMPAMIDIVTKMLSKEPHGEVVQRRGSVVIGAPVVQLYDDTNMEAVATAFILQKLVAEHLLADHEYVPVPYEGGESISKAQIVLVLCTPGVFEQASILQACMLIAEQQPALLPIMTQAMFQIPSQEATIRSMRGHMRRSDVEDPSVINSVVACLFKEIAVSFEAGSASSAVLKACAYEIAKRIKATYKHGRQASIQYTQSKDSNSSKGIQVVKAASTNSALSAQQDSRRLSISDSLSMGDPAGKTLSSTGLLQEVAEEFDIDDVAEQISNV